MSADLQAGRPPRKVLFLDVDGVLNHSGCPEWKQGDHRVLDPECVRRVKEVCERTGAGIVVSSVWRLGDGGMQRLRPVFGKLIVGGTPYHPSAPRRNEIAAWIDWASEMTGPLGAMCVVDDETDAAILGIPFVQTGFETGGFTDAHAKQVEEALR